jgi:hypothetical protein
MYRSYPATTFRTTLAEVLIEVDMLAPLPPRPRPGFLRLLVLALRGRVVRNQRSQKDSSSETRLRIEFAIGLAEQKRRREPTQATNQ